MNKINLYRVYHNESLLEKLPLQDNEIMYNTANNEYGPYLNEICCLLDDKLDLNCEYIGLEHYRRIFYDFDETILDTITDNKCITYETVYRSDFDYPYLKLIHYDLFHKQLVELFNTFDNKDYIKFLNKDLTVRRSMFIMKTNKFIELQNFIKICLDYLFKENNINVPSDIDNLPINNYLNKYGNYTFHKHRCFAFIGEFLVNIWILANMDSYETFETVYFRKQYNHYKNMSIC